MAAPNNQEQQGSNIHGQPNLIALGKNIRRIPGVFLRQMKLEAGINDDRIFESLSLEEKTRLNEVFIKTMNTYTARGAPQIDSVVNASPQNQDSTF